MTTTCPKCGHTGRDPAACERCGIIFERMHTIVDLAPLGAFRPAPVTRPELAAAVHPPLRLPDARADAQTTRPDAPPFVMAPPDGVTVSEPPTLTNARLVVPPQKDSPTPRPGIAGVTGALAIARERAGGAPTPLGTAAIGLPTIERYRAGGERRRLTLWLVLLACAGALWWTRREPAPAPRPPPARANPAP